MLVTHNIYHAYRVCDRFVIMSHGTKVFDVDKADTMINQLTEYGVSPDPPVPDGSATARDHESISTPGRWTRGCCKARHERPARRLRDRAPVSAEEANLTYSHLDRMIVGGVMPEAELSEIAAIAETGTERFLGLARGRHRQHRRRGDDQHRGRCYELGFQEALYVGMGEGALSFASRDPAEPALFYLLSVPGRLDVQGRCTSPARWRKGGRWLWWKNPTLAPSINMSTPMSATKLPVAGGIDDVRAGFGLEHHAGARYRGSPHGGLSLLRHAGADAHLSFHG